MLEKLKLLLGITDDSMDSQLSAYLVEAQEYVEDYLERQLTKGDYEDYINMEYGGFNKIVLRNFPLESIESIENLDGTVIDVESVRA
ncbi:gp6 domain containing protein, partial [uncultured Caudovirales phage]